MTAAFVHNPYVPAGPASGKTFADGRPPVGLSWTRRRVERMGGEPDLVRIIVDLFHGFAGSVPSERIQNHAKAQYPTLYAKVVDGRYQRRWNAFLGAHTAVVTLVRVPMPTQFAWRLHLTHNQHWWMADAVYAAQRRQFAEYMADVVDNVLLLEDGRRMPLRDLTEHINAIPGLEELRMRHVHAVVEDGGRRFRLDRSAWLVSKA